MEVIYGIFYTKTKEIVGTTCDKELSNYITKDGEFYNKEISNEELKELQLKYPKEDKKRHGRKRS